MNRPEFAVHMLNEDGKAKAQELAQQFSKLTDYIEAIGVQGRELSLAKTKLEEACFFAKKAMATNLSNQEL